MTPKNPEKRENNSRNGQDQVFKLASHVLRTKWSRLVLQRRQLENSLPRNCPNAKCTFTRQETEKFFILHGAVRVDLATTTGRIRNERATCIIVESSINFSVVPHTKTSASQRKRGSCDMGPSHPSEGPTTPKSQANAGLVGSVESTIRTRLKKNRPVHNKASPEDRHNNKRIILLTIKKSMET